MSPNSKLFGALCVLASLAGCASGRPTQEVTPTSPGSGAAARSSNQAVTRGDRMGGGMMAETCPMNVPGTSVAAADADGGVSLTFTSSQPEAVAELRARVKRMAEMHNRAMGNDAMANCMMGGGMAGTGGNCMMGGGMAGTGGNRMMGGGMMGGGMMGGGMMGGGMMGGSSATSEDIEGGARLVFKSKDSQHLDALRTHVKKAAEIMQQGRCPMMAAQSAAGPSDTK